MLRLFVSFYLAVIASIAVINLTTEYLWTQLQKNDDFEIHYVTEVAKSLQQILVNQNQNLSLPDTIDNAEILAYEDVAWLPFQLTALINNEPVITFDANQAFYVNLPIDKSTKILRLGPFYPKESRPINKWLVLTLSYIALAILLAIWVRPLWLDLQQLTTMTSAIASGELNVKHTSSKRSAITPLVNTMHAMANRIVRLMSDQKQLVSAVSHELRTPIARLRFAIAMLDNVDEQQKAEINEDLAEMEQLINEMLSYARLESQVSSLTKSTCNLSALLDVQVEKLRRQTTKKIIFEHHKAYEIIADPQSIERALQNILTNAVRYADSCIEVSILDSNREIEIYVDDDGPGVPKAQREEIFTPFHTIDESRSKKNAGYGLGLAIVKRIVDWHSGSCYITQSPKNGCRFVIKMPKELP